MAFEQASGIRIDPFQGFKFIVEAPKHLSNKIAFSTVSALVADIEETEYREGDDPITMRKFPGLVTFENITLERGITLNNEIEDWFNQVVNLTDLGGTAAPGISGIADFREPELKISLYGRDGAIKTWSVLNAWPKRIEVSDMDSSSSDVLIQSLELVHEGVYLSSVSAS